MPTIPEIKPEQSIELLKELHILTRDGKLNQDSRRKLKQVHHLVNFIAPLLDEVAQSSDDAVEKCGSCPDHPVNDSGYQGSKVAASRAAYRCGCRG